MHTTQTCTDFSPQAIYKPDLEILKIKYRNTQMQKRKKKEKQLAEKKQRYRLIVIMTGSFM